MEKSNINSNYNLECYNKEIKNFNSFDLAKFVCAILVVMIHIEPFGVQKTNNIFSNINFFLQDGLCRIAVPLFFIFSGFFLYRKTTFNKFSFEPSKKYLIHIFRLYLIWSLIYLPLQISEILGHSSGILYGIAEYIKKFIFIGSYNHLWYLNALLWSVTIISFLLSKKWSPKKILCVSAVFYIFGVLGDAYYGVISPFFDVPFVGKILSLYFQIFYTTRNGLFFGFFFVSLGMILSNKDILLSKNKNLFLLIVSILMLLVEVFLLNKLNMAKDYNVCLFIIPASLYIFLYLKTIKLKDSKKYIFFRMLSSIIFYSHMWILKLAITFSYFIGIGLRNTPLLFLIVLLVTILIAIIIIKLSAKKGFRWLKHFY